MFSARKTKYKKSWEVEFAWIQPCKTDVFSVLCRLCSKMFSISGGGIAQVKIHICRKLHISREKEREGQCMFKKYGDNALSIKGTQINIATKDLIRKHEIIRSLNCVKSNHSFSSTNDDSEIFKETFPNWKLLSNTKNERPKQNTPFNMAYIPF